MKTIGLIPSQSLVSLNQDDEGNWLEVPVAQTIVPLVKMPQPTFTATQKAEPHLEWFEDRVERQWIVSDLTPEEIAAKLATLPDAKRYQLKVWLIRNGIPLDTVPSIIEAAIPAGPDREEALVRWNDVELVPADHPLVAIVAAGMTPPVTVADVWPEILDIK
jgi:hypothetical protein